MRRALFPAASRVPAVWVRRALGVSGPASPSVWRGPGAFQVWSSGPSSEGLTVPGVGAVCGVLAAYAHLPGAAKVSPPAQARCALLRLRGQAWNPLVSSDPVPLGRRPRSKRSGNCPPSGQAWAHFCLLFVWPPSGESGPQVQGPASPLPFPAPGPHAPRAARGPVGGGPAGPVAVCSFGAPGSSRPGPHGTACPSPASLPGARGDTGTVGGEEKAPRARTASPCGPSCPHVLGRH